MAIPEPIDSDRDIDIEAMWKQLEPSVFVDSSLKHAIPIIRLLAAERKRTTELDSLLARYVAACGDIDTAEENAAFDKAALEDAMSPVEPRQTTIHTPSGEVVYVDGKLVSDTTNPPPVPESQMYFPDGRMVHPPAPQPALPVNPDPDKTLTQIEDERRNKERR